MGVLKLVQPPVFMPLQNLHVAKFHLRRWHVWKTSAPVMMILLTASPVPANPSLLIILIIIIKVNSHPWQMFSSTVLSSGNKLK